MMTVSMLWPMPSTLMTEVLLKSIVLLGATWLIALALRRSSAALRHAIWALAVLGMLALPFVQLLGPHWLVLPAPIVPASLPAIPMTASVLSSPTPSAPAIHQSSAHAPRPERLALVTSFPQVFLLLWALGAFVLLTRILFGLAAVRVIARKARPVTDCDWQDEIAAIRADLGIRCPVGVRQTADAPVPMIVGVLRHLLLLPMTADGWAPDRRRTVVIHELAHVKRSDNLTQSLAHVACALYWVNPLAWVAAGRVSAERERACDDVVLSTGCKASDYAEHLLAMARGLGRMSVAPMATPMVRASNIERRLRAVLDARLRRGAATRRAMVCTLVLALGAVIGLAATSCSPRTRSSALKEADVIVANGTHARTPRGAEVELLGLAVPLDPGKIDTSKAYFGYHRDWWTPDGRPADLSGLETDYEIEPTMTGSSGPTRELLFRVKAADATWVEITAKYPDMPVSISGTRNRQVNADTGWATQLFQASLGAYATQRPAQRFTARLGIADGPWDTAHTLSRHDFTIERGVHIAPLDILLMGPTATADGGIRFAIAHNTAYIDLVCRLVAVGMDGKTHVAHSRGSDSYGETGTMSDFLFDHLPLEQVKSFQFQTRPYTWLEFRNIAFSPGT